MMFGLRKVSMCIPNCDESCDGLTQKSSVSLCKENGLNGTCNITDERYSYPLQQLITEASSKGVQVIDQRKRNQNFHHACEVGNLCMVRYILSKGLSDINCRGKFGRTPVMVAARMGRFEVFDVLVNHSCDLSAVDQKKKNVLHMACIVGNTDIVRKLIFDVKYPIERRGGSGWTPVMYVAYYGHRKILDLLVDKGCILEVVDENKNNILHLACVGGHVDIVKYILSMRVVGIEDTGMNGRTPLMLAAEKGHLGVVKYLVQKGAYLRAVDDIKDNVLHVACLNGHVDIVKYILSMHVIGIDNIGQCGGTPVMKAVWSGHVSVVKFLVSKGCNLKAIDDNMDNILHVACIGGHVDMVKYILSKHVVDMEEGGLHGRTPVMRAAERGHVGVVKFLVSKGCNLNSIDKNNDNILHVACVGGHVDMVKYILSKHVVDMEEGGLHGRTPVMRAAGRGHVGVVKFLVSKVCNLNSVDENNDNILHVACVGGHVDMVKYILSKQVFDIDTKGFYGRTPVMRAAGAGNVEVVKFLVSKGCDLRARDAGRNNALHVACISGHVDMIKYLITLGFDRKEKNMNGVPFDNLGICKRSRLH